MIYNVYDVHVHLHLISFLNNSKLMSQTKDIIYFFLFPHQLIPPTRRCNSNPSDYKHLTYFKMHTIRISKV